MQKTIMLNVNTTVDLWPHQVVDVIQRVMEEGQTKHPCNLWAAMPVREHVLAGVGHAVSYLRGKGKDHLERAFTRFMMAVAIEWGYTDA